MHLPLFIISTFAGYKVVTSMYTYGRFQQHFQDVYMGWLDGVPNVVAESRLECSLQCLRVVYCMGYYFGDNQCFFMTSLSKYEVTNSSGLIMDSANFYIFTGNGSSENYILHRSLDISFKYHTTALTQDAALQQCQSENATLINVKSQAMDNFIMNIKRGEIYIGLSDIQTEGLWIWTDGSRMDYHYFPWDEPNNYDYRYRSRTADCCTVEEKWHDVYCGRRAEFICQKF